ncbi:MAG: pyridoxal phosphate biosynthetic protein [Pseudomonadota bacterium]
MSEPSAPAELTKEQIRWAGAASALFLLAIALLGYALANTVLLPLAIGWVVLQMFGYVGALKFAKGEVAHPLFKSQVMLHGMALMLMIGLLARG